MDVEGVELIWKKKKEMTETTKKSVRFVVFCFDCWF